MDTYFELISELDSLLFEVLLPSCEAGIATPLRVNRHGLQTLVNKFGVNLMVREAGDETFQQAHKIGFKVSAVDNFSTPASKQEEEFCGTMFQDFVPEAE